MVNKITGENFKNEVEDYKGTVLIDFYADWCGPCRMMSPVIDEIAEENSDIKVGKVNCDLDGDLAMKFGVMSIPTLLIFKDGKQIKEFIGLTDKDEILTSLK